MAFSGGNDSCALLLALLEVMTSDPSAQLTAAHLDHALDEDSGRRAEAAKNFCRSLGIPLVLRRRLVDRGRGESWEAAARRERYAFLEEARRARGARWIVTAHHRDDQAETVALRWLQGSGLEGLAAMAPRRGRILRPFLGVPREALGRWVQGRLDRLEGLSGKSERESKLLLPVEDPTNANLAYRRNLLRHRVLPRLSQEAPNLRPRLAGLARRAGRVRRALEQRLSDHLGLNSLGVTPPGIDPLDPDFPENAGPNSGSVQQIRVSAQRLQALPRELLPFALALLHRRAGAPYPASTAARGELVQQLERREPRETAVGCDCGGGWRWELRGETFLVLQPSAPASAPDPFFSYTLEAPGVLELPEIGLRLSVRRARPADRDDLLAAAEAQAAAERRGPHRLDSLPAATPCWGPTREALELPWLEEGALTVRTRQPGDRMQPPGSRSQKRLKDLLIDRRIPHRDRDRLPLLCLNQKDPGRVSLREALIWAPWVTLDRRCLIRDPARAWWVELTHLPNQNLPYIDSP